MAELGVDTEKLEDAALVILIALHGGNRVWKSLDWAVTDRLHAKGLIEDPARKAKSLVLNDGLARAQGVLAAEFVERRPAGSQGSEP